MTSLQLPRDILSHSYPLGTQAYLPASPILIPWNLTLAYDQFLERTANMRPLPPNQHYGECEAVGPNNELGCDILNDDGSPNPPTLEDGTPNVPTTLDPCRNIPANLTCHHRWRSIPSTNKL